MKKSLLKTLASLTLIFALPCTAALAEGKTVGIVQLVENGAFSDMREGFIARIRELGYSHDDVSFDYQNASGDMSNLATICQGFADEKVDAVVAIATPAAQTMVNMESGIPTFFVSVSNPIGAGVITDMGAPDRNATGTSNAIPVDEMFRLSDTLTPGCTHYGLIYCASQVNSVTTIESAKAYCDQNGLTYTEAVVTNSSELYEAALMLIDSGVNAIFCPNDSVVQDGMSVIASSAAEAGVPVYGSSAVMVASGAFATISIDDPTIGARTADMLDAYLKGTPIEQIPALVVSDFTTVINSTTAAALGVTLPQDVLSAAVILE